MDKKKKIAIVVAAVIGAAVAGIVAYMTLFKPTEVDLQAIMAEPAFSGCNESGAINGELTVSKDAVAEAVADIKSEDKSKAVEEFCDSIKYIPSKKDALANGDEITIKATYDQNLADKSRITVKNDSFTYNVDGLPICADDTLYECVKVGDTVYCTAGNSVNAVDLKTKKIKVLVSAQGYIDNLTVKDGYVYYCVHGNGIGGCDIYRINRENGEITNLVSGATNWFFCIVGDYIYYDNRRMNLDGSNKTQGVHSCKQTVAKSNVAGYSMSHTFDEPNPDDENPTFMNKYFLNTPSGQIFAGQYEGI